MIPHDFIRSIKIPKNIQKAFFYTLILELFTHFFILTNKLINHDDLEQLVSKMDYSSSGRWFLQYANLPSSYFSMPWVNGILILIYSSIITSIIVYVLNIKSKLNIMLISAIMIMFPSNAALFSYTNSYDAYLFGAVLAFIGLYLFVKYKYGFIVTIILTVLSLATYQTFISLCLLVLISYYFMKLINEKINSRIYIKNILKVFLTYISSIIFYIISCKFLINVELSSYQNIDKMGNLNIFSLPELIFRTYYKFYAFLINDDYFQFGFTKYLNIILLFGIFYLLYILVSKLELNEKVVAILTILILPIIINLIFIMAPNSAIGLRMLQGYIGMYVFFITILEYFVLNKFKFKNFRLIAVSMWYIILPIIFSLYNFFIVTNKVYTTLEIDTINVISYTTRVINNIENQEFYEKHKPVYFIGNPDTTTSFTEKYTTREVLKSTILDKKLPAHYFWKLYPERYSAFPNKIENIWKVNYDKIEDNLLIEKINSAPIYPKKGSIFEYNNSIFIKFKNYQ